MSMVGMMIADFGVSAAADCAGLHFDQGSTRSVATQKLFATETSVVGVAGVVWTNEIDVIDIVRTTMRSATGASVDLVLALEIEIGHVAQALAHRASSHRHKFSADVDAVCDIVVAGPGHYGTLSIRWNGSIDKTTQRCGSDPLVVFVGTLPAQPEMSDVAASVRANQSLGASTEALLATASAGLQRLVLRTIAEPPLINRQPVVAGPIHWAELKQGSLLLEGQTAPAANVSLRP